MPAMYSYGSNAFLVILLWSLIKLDGTQSFSSRGWTSTSTSRRLSHGCDRKTRCWTMQERDNSGDQDVEVEVDATTLVIRKVLDVMRDSALIDEKHAEHCASPSVTHLFKGTPLVKLPDKLKLQFVDSWAGRALATVMAEEQDYLGDWKLQKIIEAAGDYNAEQVADRISRDINSNRIVVYSFEDCPWCVATKELLSNDPYDPSLTTVIDLEDCGLSGKHIRAELSKMTGRTSMPCIFLGGIAIGGFTDGDPCGPGIKNLHETGELINLIKQ